METTARIGRAATPSTNEDWIRAEVRAKMKWEWENKNYVEMDDDDDNNKYNGCASEKCQPNKNKSSI